MAGSAKQRLVTEKRGFRVKPLKHPRYRYVLYRIEEVGGCLAVYFPEYWCDVSLFVSR
jgi:hypothetical protein